MVKRYKNPNYGDIKKSRIKFAILPKKFKTENEIVWIWFEKYIDCYKYTCVGKEDYWKYTHSELVK